MGRSVRIISGVEAQVVVNGRLCFIGDDGCISSVLTDRDFVFLGVISTRKNTHVFTVTLEDKKTNKRRVNELRHGPESTSERYVYSRSMPVRKGHGDFYVDSRTNAMHMIAIYPPNFTFHELRVVSRHGKFFLTAQLQTGLCYRDETSNLRCPLFEEDPKRPRHSGWPEMIEFLKKRTAMAERSSKIFPHINEYRPKPDLPLEKLKEKEGFVRWWNIGRGIGAFVTRTGDEVRMHHTKVVAKDRVPILREGDLVTFDELQAPTGNTSFKYEAIGVRVVSLAS